MDDHDAFIDTLSRDAKPVKRPLAPGVRAVLWTALALPAGALAVTGLNRAFISWSAPVEPWVAVELATAFVLGGLAVVSAFNLTIAGRKPVRWQWFAGVALLWLAASVVSVAKAADPWGHVGSGSGCYIFMMTASGPMIVLSILSIRRTRTLYPLRTLSAAGLGTACMTAALLTLCHPPSGDLPDLLMHMAAAATIVAATVVLGRRWVELR